jgi:putative DNA primase/helicase
VSGCAAVHGLSDEAIAQAYAAMAACNEWEPTRAATPADAARSDPRPAGEGDRPGDHFNRDASWSEILSGHGWRVHHKTERVTFWTRPGKDPRDGLSATTGFCRGDQTGERLYVFTSSAPPLEPNTSYSKLGALALLDHGGDFAAAASALQEEGLRRAGRVFRPRPRRDRERPTGGR